MTGSIFDMSNVLMQNLTVFNNKKTSITSKGDSVGETKHCSLNFILKTRKDSGIYWPVSKNIYYLEKGIYPKKPY